VAIAHERFRLEKLQEILERRLEHADDQTAMDALKQAARERGKAFTNVRDVQSKGEKVEPPDIFVYGGEPPEEEQP
jgi:glycerate-2-kinase